MDSATVSVSFFLAVGGSAELRPEREVPAVLEREVVQLAVRLSSALDDAAQGPLSSSRRGTRSCPSERGFPPTVDPLCDLHFGFSMCDDVRTAQDGRLAMRQRGLQGKADL